MGISIPFVYTPILIKITESYLSRKGLTFIQLQNVDVQRDKIQLKGLSFTIPEQEIRLKIPAVTILIDSLWDHQLKGIILESPVVHLDSPIELGQAEILHEIRKGLSFLQECSVFDVQKAKIMKDSFGTLDVTAHQDAQKHLVVDIAHDQLSHLNVRLHQNPQGIHLQAFSPFFSYKIKDVVIELEKIQVELEEKEATYQLKVITDIGKVSYQPKDEKLGMIELPFPLETRLDFFHDLRNVEKGKYSFMLQSPVLSRDVMPLLRIQGDYNSQTHQIDTHIQSQKLKILEWKWVQELLRRQSPLKLTTAIMEISGRIQVPLETEAFWPSWEKMDLSSLILGISAINGSYDKVNVKNGKSTILFQKEGKDLRTKNLQFTCDDVTINEMSFKRGLVSYALSFPGWSDVKPVIYGVDFSSFGGIFHLDHFVLSEKGLNKNGFECHAAFQEVNLEPLIRAADLGSFAMEGYLSGKVEMSWSPIEGVTILRGNAGASSLGGVIRYNAPESAKTPESKLFLDALKDFRYQKLEIQVEPKNWRKRKSQASVKILGFSPNVLNGYPFEINIKTTGRLHELVQNGLWEIS